MANHAKVCTGKTLNPDEVNEIVQRLNKEKLGGVFTITYEKDVPNGWGKHQWHLSYKGDDYLGMVFWLTDDIRYGEGDEYGSTKEFVEYDEPKTLSTQSCIEFRHGHSFQFMWWVEGVFRENLGKHYNAEMYDDGTGWEGPAKPDRYETFEKYMTNNGKLTKKEINKWLKLQMEGAPSELVETLKLNF
jgi:hypothetical protein